MTQIEVGTCVLQPWQNTVGLTNKSAKTTIHAKKNLSCPDDNDKIWLTLMQSHKSKF